MMRTIVVTAVATALLGSAAIFAQAQQPQQPTPSFFVAENPNGTGNLGGLAGADQICQTQAQSLGGQAATRTWHAYLSQEQRGNQPRINARDRIGSPLVCPLCRSYNSPINCTTENHETQPKV
jgi:opacity protein-like surface antigen